MASAEANFRSAGRPTASGCHLFSKQRLRNVVVLWAAPSQANQLDSASAYHSCTVRPSAFADLLLQCEGQVLALRFIRRTAASYLLLRQKRLPCHRRDTIPARWTARAQPRPGAILGRSMRCRSPWLRCLRSRRPDDPDDGAKGDHFRSGGAGDGAGASGSFRNPCS